MTICAPTPDLKEGLHCTANTWFSAVSLASALALCAAHLAIAAGPLTKGAVNAKWNYAVSSRTATFLGTDQPGTAQLELKKAVLIGGVIAIQSDGKSVQLTSGSAPPMVIAVPAKPDGATTTMKLDGGDDPHLTVNDVQSPRLQGKWIQLVRDPSEAMTVELNNATFATVHIDPGHIDPGSAGNDVAPTPAPENAPVSQGRELLHDVPAARLIASEKQFATSVVRTCPHCNGTGKVTEEQQVGERKEGAFDVPITQDVTRTCPVCNGTGTVRASDEVLQRLSGSFLKNLAHVDQSDPAAQDAISQSYDMITNSMIGDFKTWTMLNRHGRSILSRPTPETGTPVIAQVEVLRCSAAQSGQKDFIARVVGTDQQVHIMNPVSADRIDSGFALMGGFIDNASIEAGTTEKLPVIANGFLVAPPIEKTWYWWWDWRWNGR